MSRSSSNVGKQSSQVSASGSTTSTSASASSASVSGAPSSASVSASTSNVSNTNNSAADNARYIELSEADAAKVDLSTVKWEDAVEHHTKNTLRNQRRVEYDVPGVGVVAEEWRIQLVTVDGRTEQEAALHSVFVDGRPVRQVDMKTGQVLAAEAAYAPFDFLRYDAYGSTEDGGGGGGGGGKGESQVPVISSKAKENGGQG
ncbi:hypothetical protein TYRP_006942 [Tyrophagus putrescentiae]|nr:hypothetical protein TYRP_006942 [Tyrophagus putrescentiae]